MSSVQLPNEVIDDILSRLDVKDLLRFKCISKSWHALISDQYFVKKHLERCTESKTNANLSLIVASHRFGSNCSELKKINLQDDLVVSHYNPGGLFETRKPYFSYDLIGSCNGLVCLADREDDEIAIWNPSTRDIRKLPAIPLDLCIFRHRSTTYCKVTCGFGHDRFSDDYKVVKIVQIFRNLDHSLLGTESRVYCLKTNSWSKKDFSPNKRLCSRHGIFVSTANALLWVVIATNLIISFGLGVDDNEYYEVEQPDYESKVYFINLSVLRGCLCIFTKSHNSNDLWIMKEYGVKESWTRLISIPGSCQTCSDKDLMQAYSWCGDKVLLKKFRSYKLMWYDLKTKEITIVKVSLPSLENYCVGQVVCLQSLVPVNGGGSDELRKKSIRRKRKRKTIHS